MQKQSTTQFKDDSGYARNAHSAIFAEVKVDDELGVIRVTRIVSAVAAGRILNPKTTRSQIAGGVVWGIGMALHEETLIDHQFGRVINADFAEYHVPVNADVHDIDVIFLDEPDDIINPLGIRVWARSASSALLPRFPMRFITRPANASRLADHARQAAALIAPSSEG